MGVVWRCDELLGSGESDERAGDTLRPRQDPFGLSLEVFGDTKFCTGFIVDRPVTDDGRPRPSSRERAGA